MNARHVWLGTVLTAVFLAGLGFGSSGTFAQQNPGASQKVEPLPPDINPDTLSRLPRPKREDFTIEKEKQEFDRLMADIANRPNTTKGAMGNPLTRAHLPTMAWAFRNTIDELRQLSGLEPKYVELATLVAARETDNKVEWVAHENNILKYFSRDMVELIRNKREVKDLGEKETTLIQFGRELFRDPKVSSKTFANMERIFGRRTTLAVTLIMGYYEGSGTLFRVYDQHLNPGERAFP